MRTRSSVHSSRLDAVRLARPIAAEFRRTPLVLGLVVGLMAGLIGSSLSADRAAAQLQLTSDCPNGESVCRVESAASNGEAGASDALAQAVGLDPAEPTEAKPLVLTNEDVGATRAMLVEREAAERAAERQRARAARPEPEVWVSVPEKGEPVAIGVERSDPGGSKGAAAADSTGPAVDMGTCMERSIRAGNGFIESRRVCETLYPDS